VASAAGAAPPVRGGRAPPRLAETGLYSDFASRTVDARNLPFVPQYPLWSDGSRKSRWIRLPPGTAIDARDPDHWRFPVGTKLWKEFAWGRRVETRYLERTRAGWIFASYAWNEDESDAVLAPETGLVTTAEVAPGRRHAIPSAADCRTCHQGGRSEVLGFSALQLSPDRDPLAVHGEPLAPGMVTLDALLARGLVRGLPRAVAERPPRIAASTPRGRAALGYLHGNCSACHDAVGPLAGLGLDLRHRLDAREPRDEPAWGAIGHPSRFAARGPARAAAWIDPGRPETSAVVARMASRHAAVQMPPLGTQVVDDDALALVRGWIAEDLAPLQVMDARRKER
jgi:mono/diheme cytochrome c family protein